MTNSRNVLFVHSSNEMYGADRMLLRVLAALPEGVKPTVWLPDDTSSAANSLSTHLTKAGIGYEVRAMPVLRRKYLNAPGLARLFKGMIAGTFALRKMAPDAVFCMTSAVLTFAPISRLAGVKSVVLYNQEIWTDRESWILGILARACTNAVAISDASLKSLRGPIANRAVTIANGVPDRDPAYGPIVDRSGPVRFFIGSRWNSWKGHETLLEAWDSNVAPGLLVIAGSAPPLGQGVDVEGLVEALKHPGSVSVVGETDDVTKHIDYADFVIIPSDAPEPFGLLAIEAFARARPVIASDAGGLARIVQHGHTGLKFPSRNASELRLLLQTEATRERAIRMGREARADYEESYSSEKFRVRFVEFWSTLF
ncbi:glycosyltransferase [Cryobacterium cheniae]|uniref:Glycosyltransferase n=1 Tax=Cryobacterium cheniae TaxID=1259262 RepID=A0A4R8XV39_9MICO|nr:glycosyltransferase family 4 protein [Cryobacterium cheniae]TFC82990.1 glycosyltransferase [Cryobacterium cheniae]